MRNIALCILPVLAIACMPAPKENPSPFSSGRWIDLSYSFDESTVYWPTAEPFHLDTVFAGITEKGYYYSAFQFCLAEHGGTHLDAPVHFAEGKWAVEEIPLEQGIGEAIVVDLSGKAAANPDYQFTVADLEAWETDNGRVPEGAIVLFRTGFGKYWPDREAYMGTAERGPAAVAKLHFPGISPELASWFVAERNIKAVGLDTPSLDYGQSQLFESHRILFEQNIIGLENLANLEELPAKGAWIIALPMKIKGGSGGPLRIVAFLQG